MARTSPLARPPSPGSPPSALLSPRLTDAAAGDFGSTRRALLLHGSGPRGRAGGAWGSGGRGRRPQPFAAGVGCALGCLESFPGQVPGPARTLVSAAPVPGFVQRRPCPGGNGEQWQGVRGPATAAWRRPRGHGNKGSIRSDAGKARLGARGPGPLPSPARKGDPLALPALSKSPVGLAGRK